MFSTTYLLIPAPVGLDMNHIPDPYCTPPVASVIAPTAQIKHAKLARELEAASLGERALGDRVEELEQELADVSATCRCGSRVDICVLCFAAGCMTYAQLAGVWQSGGAMP
jgi:hypothetical protein